METLNICCVLFLVLFFGLVTIVFAINWAWQKRKVQQYKTGVWLAIGKAQRGKPFNEIFGAMECYMPESDREQFRNNFAEKD